jgi:hypothetical protein
LLRMAPPEQFSATNRPVAGSGLRLIGVTDTAFSSNRFARTHQVHRLIWQAELEDI